MKFRQIDQITLATPNVTPGDWGWGQGVSSYATDEKAIDFNIYTRLNFFLNDCFFAMDQGIDWMNLLGAKNPQAKQSILLQTRNTLVTTEGVVRVTSVDSNMPLGTRSLNISYNVDTTFTRNLRNSVSISPTP